MKTSANESDELPPGSRITSRIEGDALLIAIPGGRGDSGWSTSVLGAFFAVVFTAQGILTRHAGWIVAGAVFLLGALIYAPMLRRRPDVVVRITEQGVWLSSGKQRHWPRGDAPPELLMCGLLPGERRWIGGQIRRKWKLPPVPDRVD